MFSWGIERDRGMKWVKSFVLGKLTFGTATFNLQLQLLKDHSFGYCLRLLLGYWSYWEHLLLIF